MRTVTCDVSDGLSLTADEWGDPASPGVLLLHGAGQNRHAWKNTAAALSDDGWFVLSADARGHGDSDWSTEQLYDFEHTGADVVALLDRFAEPPVAIGASMGGMSALAAQDLYGDGPLFRALVLVDIAPNFAADGAMRIVKWMAANPDGFASLEEAADAMAAYNPNRPRPSDLTGLNRVLRLADDGRWHWRWDPKYITSKAGYGDGDEDEMRERIARASDRMLDGARKVQVPLLLVRGGKSDLVTLESAQEFLEAVPGTEFVDVAGTGHMVSGDDNDAFTAAVIEFLSRVRKVGSGI